ncbi:hypothetical protein Tco_1363010 [Tanacetum coccineum]
MHRTSKPKSTLKNKTKSDSGESCVLKIPLKFKIKKIHIDPEAPIPTTKQIDLENMTEAQQLSYTLAKRDESTADDMILSQEIPNTRIDPGSNKESLKGMKIDDHVATIEEEAKSAEAALIQKKGKSVMENMNKTFIRKDNVRTMLENVDNTLKEVIPKIVSKTTDEIMQDNLHWLVVDVVKKEKDRTKADVPALVSQEFIAHAPQIIEELFRTYMNNTVLNVHPSSTSLISDMQYQFSAKKIDPDEVFSNKKIVEIIKVVHHDAYMQELIDEVCVKRFDDKSYLFLESDFKYLNKNDIKDMYYICMRRRNDPQYTALIKVLLVFIRSCVIWEMVHDFQLGIESYQIKVNLTAPTITFPGIETLLLYSIIADPFVGIIYENKKGKKEL